ncbi:MAG: class I SAM-dependent methyltransferase [Chloroflexi bacterium]|nr:class I SAM-dependent methyltransferase [Chloroflexota bacterium]
MTREHEDRLLFDRIAQKYARKDVAISSALARKDQLLTAMRQAEGEAAAWGTIVDVGCGVGAPAQYLQGRYQKYIGIDQSSEMIEAAKIYNREMTDASFFADNVKETQLPSHSADAILSIGALHHMTELDKVMHSIVSIAKPNAKFVVIEPQNGNLLIQFMRWVRGLIDKGYSREQTFFAEYELVDLFTRHSITQLKISYQGYFSTPFAQVIASNNKLLIALSRLSIRMDNWLQSHLRGPLQKLSFDIIITGVFPAE